MNSAALEVLKTLEQNKSFSPHVQQKILNHYRTGEFPLQSTLSKTVYAEGRGRTHARPIQIALEPAPVNTGIVFRRTDIKTDISIPAVLSTATVHAEHISLHQEGISVQGVDHLLSALYGLKIDNVFVNVNGPELPAMEESAEAFIFLIQSAGIKMQPALKKLICIKEKFHLSQGSMWISIEPSENLKIRYIPKNDNVHTQTPYNFTLSTRLYIKELGRTRHDVVLNSKKYVLRYSNEVARHATLDMIGSVGLLAANLQGMIHSYRADLEFHLNFLRCLLEQSNYWYYSENPYESDAASELYLASGSYY